MPTVPLAALVGSTTIVGGGGGGSTSVTAMLEVLKVTDTDTPAPGVGVELVDEAVTARPQWRDDDEGVRARREHFLDAQFEVLELARPRPLVAHDEFDAAPGGHFEPGGLDVAARLQPAVQIKYWSPPTTNALRRQSTTRGDRRRRSW